MYEFQLLTKWVWFVLMWNVCLYCPISTEVMQSSRFFVCMYTRRVSRYIVDRTHTSLMTLYLVIMAVMTDDDANIYKAQNYNCVDSEVLTVAWWAALAGKGIYSMWKDEFSIFLILLEPCVRNRLQKQQLYHPTSILAVIVHSGVPVWCLVVHGYGNVRI